MEETDSAKYIIRAKNRPTKKTPIDDCMHRMIFRRHRLESILFVSHKQHGGGKIVEVLFTTISIVLSAG